jgi:hypothetical protein
MIELKNLKITLLKIKKLDILQEIFFSGIGCLFVILIFNLFPNDWHFDSSIKNNYRPKTIIAIIVIIFLIIFLLSNRLSVNSNNSLKINYKLNIIIFSMFNFALIYFLFYNTDFSICGINDDNWYRMAYISHMAESGYPHDYCYKGLSAYYFPVYYYILALIAKNFQIEPYKMLRFGFLFCYYIIPILLFEVWKKIYNAKTSFLISAISLVFLLDPHIISHLICILFLIPYVMYYYENCTLRIFKFRQYFNAGILGSFLFCLYPTYFFILPIYYIIKLFLNKNELILNFKRLTIITLLMILFSMWFWLPLLIDLILIGSEIHQNTLYNEIMIEIPFFSQVVAFSLIGFIMIIGLVFIFKRYSINRDIKILGNLFISIYILILIGFISILLKSPFFLFYRFFKIPKYILIISCSIFYVRFSSYITKINPIKKYNLNGIILKIETYLIIGLICYQSYINSKVMASVGTYEIALDQKVPNELIDVFEELEYKDKVFLTSYNEVCPFIPVYLFLCPVPHFSHPSALHNERVDFLRELAKCKTSESFYLKVINCKYDIIDYFFLKSRDNYTTFQITVWHDEFRNTKGYDILFNRSLFQNYEYFEEFIIEDYVIYKTNY